MTLIDKAKKALEGATPGPWSTDSDMEVIGRHGYLVADLLVLDKNPTTENKANAQLISLAPDLARALIAAEEVIRLIEDAPANPVISHETADQIEATIAKFHKAVEGK